MGIAVAARYAIFTVVVTSLAIAIAIASPMLSVFTTNMSAPQSTLGLVHRSGGLDGWILISTVSLSALFGCSERLSRSRARSTSEVIYIIMINTSSR
ncbi:hypothetical protein J3A83DRAFT_4366824 [Scleroderma citrinum]